MRAYCSIGSFTKLLQLLERTGVSAVIHGGHDGGDMSVVEVSNADRRVGTIRNSERARVDWFEAARGRSRGKLWVPEDSRGGSELARDAQRGRRTRLDGGGSGRSRFDGICNKVKRAKEGPIDTI